MDWYIVSNELYHHGIKGQKWGKRNGPPYPLDVSDHSESEKKAGWQKSLDQVAKEKSRDYNKSKKETWKRVGKVAAITAISALAIYGIHKAATSEKFQSLVSSGQNCVKDLGPKRMVGRSPNKLDLTMIKKINSSGPTTHDRQINCVHCTTAYVLNSLFGKNVTAKGCLGVDEVSGLVMGGRDTRIFKAIFDGVKTRETPKGESFSKALSDLPNGSTGILFIRNLSPFFGGVGHVINYEKDNRGVVSLIDGQIGRTFSQYEGNLFYSLRGLGSVVASYDFSQAALKPNAGDILKHMVDGF